eukprot:1400972-Prymnesium_polylepis.2
MQCYCRRPRRASATPWAAGSANRGVLRTSAVVGLSHSRPSLAPHPGRWGALRLSLASASPSRSPGLRLASSQFVTSWLMSWTWCSVNCTCSYRGAPITLNSVTFWLLLAAREHFTPSYETRRSRGWDGI